MTPEELSRAKEICERKYLDCTGMECGYGCDECAENEDIAAEARTLLPKAIAEIERLKEFEWKYKELCK